MKPDQQVIVKRERYPSGAEHFVVYLGVDRVGGFDYQRGGYVPFGCRKPLPSIEDAAKETLWRRIRKVLGEGARLSKALNLPITIVAGRIPDTGAPL
jgi:hypothetical protein